jgi:hypothetical protein
MKRSVKPPSTVVARRILLLLALVAAPAALGGCGHDIGDDCKTSADCDPNGTRACDLSQPGGYCTINGCDATSCPSESACIRTFPEMFLTQPCDPACEDLDCTSGRTDDCAADELCLDAGKCAKRSFEQRLCVKLCGEDGDCRGGYECRPTGTRGSMLLSTDSATTGKFCAPKPQ